MKKSTKKGNVTVKDITQIKVALPREIWKL